MKTEKDIIEGLWNRIDKVESRIEELNKKGLDYYSETHKRKSLLNNVKRLERKKNENRR